MIVIMILVDSLMPMLLAVALLAAAFTLATQAKFPLADTDSYILAIFKVALESRITVVNRLGRVHYLNNLRRLCHHACWHDHLLRHLLLLLKHQGRDWLNTVNSHLWDHWLLNHDRLASGHFVDSQLWGR